MPSPAALRCAIVILAFQTHCGDDCRRGNQHTQDWNVAHMVRSLDHQLLVPKGLGHSVVIFEEDYNATQRRTVRAQTDNPVIFEDVDFSPRALPVFLRGMLDRISADVRPTHRNGNLSSPSMRGTWHGTCVERALRMLPLSRNIVSAPVS